MYIKTKINLKIKSCAIRKSWTSIQSRAKKYKYLSKIFITQFQNKYPALMLWCLNLTLIINIAGILWIFCTRIWSQCFASLLQAFF
jgi:hypothetical protein